MTRLATYNLLHGVPVLGGARGAGDAGRLAELATSDDSLLRESVQTIDADVIGLQEVDVQQPRSNNVNQVRSIAEALGAAHWRFAPSVAGTPGENGWLPSPHENAHGSDLTPDLAGDGPLYGVGLVSRLPVLEWRTTQFKAAPLRLPLMIPAEPRPRFMSVSDEPRSAIAAVIQGERSPFTVVTAHLSFVPGYNVRQLRQLRAWVAGLPRPLILLGDFNLPGLLPARITGWTSLIRQPTYPSMRPSVQLDHVLADGLTNRQIATATARVHLLPVSDHAAVSVEVDL
ncbi:MAG: endonuclease/exonuclease/phosphatase family protein [Actinomycetes bacterium]